MLRLARLERPKSSAAMIRFFLFEIGITDHPHRNEHHTQMDDVPTVTTVIAANQINQCNKWIFTARRVPCLNALPEFS